MIAYLKPSPHLGEGWHGEVIYGHWWWPSYRTWIIPGTWAAATLRPAAGPASEGRSA